VNRWLGCCGVLIVISAAVRVSDVSLGSNARVRQRAVPIHGQSGAAAMLTPSLAPAVRAVDPGWSSPASTSSLRQASVAKSDVPSATDYHGTTSVR